MSLSRYMLLAIFIGLGICVSAQTPTTHSSNITFTNLYCHTVDVAWTKGNGTNRLVVVKEGSAVNAKPTDYQVYSARDTFGKGTELTSGSGNFAVYSGTGASFKLRELKKNTTYHVAIFEFNISSGDYLYYTENSYATASFTTEDITPAFSIDKTYQCIADNKFTYTNSSSNSLGNSMTYSWDYGDKITSSQTNPSHVYSEGGIFKVTLTAMSTGCKASTILRDTVGVPFITYFELDTSIKTNDSLQCFNGNRFNILNKFKVPPPIYGLWDRTKNSWTTSDGQKGTAADFDFIAKSYGKITVKLVQSRQVSKGGEYCVDSFQRDFYVLPPPLKNANVDFSDTLLCLHEKDFVFTHDASDIKTTLWEFGDGSTSTSNPANHSYNSIGKYEVSLNVEDNFGCRDSFADSVEVVSTPDNFFSGLDPVYCLGDPSVKLYPNLYGGQFKGGNVNSVDSTFNPNAVGKYTVSYVYQLGNCKDTFSESTEVRDRPKIDIGPDTLICPQSSITLDAGTDTLVLNWSTGASTRTISVSGGGIYWVKGSNGYCTGGDTINIQAVKPPVFELGLDTTICGGQKITVVIKSDAGTILWNDGNTSWTRDITQSGYYQVTVTHPCATLRDSFNVEILPYACEMFIPNIFSPNGDILNELFYPIGFFKFTDMLIFDEYGMKLYETTDITKGWDGTYMDKPCQPGMYYYLIRYQLPGNGSYEKKVAKGSVYLIR
ncbi:MAG: PKD domain-containing protein [Bacteroidetes bacterium]|nr:PKD domain-containing protein [Bacteroidota bacterium]